jgi:signal transduction histidine kinase
MRSIRRVRPCLAAAYHRALSPVHLVDPQAPPPTPSTPSTAEPTALPPTRPRGGLRLRLVLVLGALAILAFVPLYAAVAGLTRHTLRASREDGARALGRAVAGRLATDAGAGRDDRALRDVAEVSIDNARPGEAGVAEGVVAIRVLFAEGRAPIEIGAPGPLAALRGLAPNATAPRPGERTMRAEADGAPLLDVEVASPRAIVQVALRVGDQASRAAPLLRLVAFYTSGFAAMMIVVAYLLLTRAIVRPVGALVEATRSLEAGTTRRIDPATVAGGASEIVELGSAIARTTGRLVEREETLAAKVGELERARTELIAARDAMIRGERLASVGRLSAGLAHEVGNPIAALLGLEEVLLDSELDAESRDLVERMKRETERVHRIMRDLLDFARADMDPTAPTSGPDATCAVRDIVDEVVALVRPQKAIRDLSLNVEVADGLPPVRMAGARLQQVLLNLVLNAADAILERTDARSSAAPERPLGRVRIAARLDGEARVRLEVEDDGPGVPERVRRSLFEPFVTTKDVGKGTGLGLAVCRGLVEGAGGTISLVGASDASGASGASGASDVPGALGGAHFVLELPTLAAPPRMRSVAPPPSASAP